MATLFLFLVSACTRQTPWVCSDVQTQQGNSVLLSHAPENKFRGIGLQLLQINGQTYAYLNVFQRAIPTLPDNDHSAIVVLEIEKETFPYEGFLMEGGQRILLPQAAKEKLIEALVAQETVTLYLDGYMSKISPEGSKKLYKKLNCCL